MELSGCAVIEQDKGLTLYYNKTCLINDMHDFLFSLIVDAIILSTTF